MIFAENILGCRDIFAGVVCRGHLLRENGATFCISMCDVLVALHDKSL